MGVRVHNNRISEYGWQTNEQFSIKSIHKFEGPQTGGEYHENDWIFSVVRFNLILYIFSEMKSFVQSYPLIFDNIIFNFILFHVPTNPLPRPRHHPASHWRTQRKIINPQSIAIERIAGEKNVKKLFNNVTMRWVGRPGLGNWRRMRRMRGKIKWNKKRKSW